ncbi:Sesquiterpene synthase [Morella rubra]|uniref:Sesquiterpene synthase n=1 Tax=Morella rubra TaxID=262757 RepID=A0A6A1UTH5_9ROSI|nr:Sesquiterpene synthase [Morella rubra]
MSQLPASAIPMGQINNPKSDVKRPLQLNYRPSIWGDRFLSNPTKSMENDGNLVQHQRFKEEVQRMLRAPIRKPLEKLELIDAIQRLGVSYHFEREIDDLLGGINEYHSIASKKHVWERSCADQLPEYMKLVYNALLDVFEEIEEEMSKQGKLYCICYAKEAEYMRNARVSCAYFLLTTVTLAGMGENAAKEAFDWLFTQPTILKEAETICRVMDDIVSNEEAIDEFQKQIVSSWKNINKELILRPTQVPMPLLVLVLNLTRVMDLLYKDEDAYTLGGGVLKEGIALLLVDPVPI